MIRVTYDDYDKMSEIFEMIKESGFKPYWPDPNEIELLYSNPNKWIKFACYLYDTNPEPETTAEKYSKKNLQEFINKNLKLID